MATGLRIEQQNGFRFTPWIVGIVLVVLLVVAGWFGYRYYTTGEQPPIPVAFAAANPEVDESTVTSEQKDSHKVPANLPRYISIPALGVDSARVMSVGVKSNGELDTPKNIFDVGWYDKSATPGSGSSALLLDGHNGGPTKGGVFEKLPELKLGDQITIERGDGKKYTYEVAENKTLSLDDLNSGGMKRMSESASDVSEGLNLISCTGNWVPAKNTYDQRVTIRAIAVE
ncbi:sortase [Candidatus Saccharibacteria bacterium]|nr:sortase [Candidatus Saccharibacteria bacterium]MBH2007122.1 sortase [Candidatus Saccharibacteria bacterium]